MQILIVEDELYVAELIQHGLEQSGHRCVLARDATDADHVLAKQTVDAITLDLGIPGKNGLAWLESLHGSRPDLSARTLVITGMHIEPDEVERVANCHAGLLAKPFRMQHLQDAVRAQLAHRRDDAA